MKVLLNDVGKRYRREWIFRGLSLTLESEKAYALTGHNGSGKSTLMRILSGHLSPTTGSISFLSDTGEAIQDDFYKYISFASPYMELIEEFTLEEAVEFHQQFKPFIAGITPEEFYDILALARAKGREIRFFSSGMKQRLKLLLAILSDSTLVLLDEPGTNLDKQGINWYLDLIGRYAKNRLVVVASNVPDDFQFCTEKVDITHYKPRLNSGRATL